jgi:hypothetical protein
MNDIVLCSQKKECYCTAQDRQMKSLSQKKKTMKSVSFVFFGALWLFQFS